MNIEVLNDRLNLVKEAHFTYFTHLMTRVDLFSSSHEWGGETGLKGGSLISHYPKKMGCVTEQIHQNVILIKLRKPSLHNDKLGVKHARVSYNAVSFYQ